MFEAAFWISYAGLWALVVALMVAVFLLYRYHGQQLLGAQDKRETQGPPINLPLPDMTLIRLDGKQVLVTDTKPRACFLYFAQTTCKPCNEAKPALGRFAQRNEDRIQTILICAGNSAHIHDFVQELPAQVSVVPDRHSRLFESLKVSSTPFALLTDEEGVVRLKGAPVSDQAFEEFVDSLLDMHRV